MALYLRASMSPSSLSTDTIVASPLRSPMLLLLGSRPMLGRKLVVSTSTHLISPMNGSLCAGLAKEGLPFDPTLDCPDGHLALVTPSHGNTGSPSLAFQDTG